MGAGANIAIGDDRHIDQRDLGSTAVDADFDLLVGGERNALRYHAGDASPVARPVMVGSRCSGKALLVPVEMPAIGTASHSETTARCVPSPPNTMIAETPAAAMSRAARFVSSTVLVTGMSR